MRKFFLFGLGILFSLTMNGQDIHFSQFYASPLYLSPSYAGTSDGIRISAIYRDQWPGIKDAFTTYALGIDYNLAALRSGLGVLVTRDQKGELGFSFTNVGVIYSYDIFTSTRVHVRPGIQFSYIQSGIDYTNLRLREQLVLGTPVSFTKPDFDSYKYFDLGLSCMAYTERLWLGTRFDHLLLPAQIPDGSERTPLKIDIYGGAELKFRGRSIREKNEHLLAAFNYRFSDVFKQLDIGVMYISKGLEMGAWYRGIPAIRKNQENDAVIFSLGYIFYNWNLLYSHDFTISGLGTNSNGANEISLVILFDNPYKVRKKRGAIKCPTFNFRQAGK